MTPTLAVIIIKARMQIMVRIRGFLVFSDCLLTCMIVSYSTCVLVRWRTSGLVAFDEGDGAPDGFFVDAFCGTVGADHDAVSGVDGDVPVVGGVSPEEEVAGLGTIEGGDGGAALCLCVRLVGEGDADARERRLGQAGAVVVRSFAAVDVLVGVVGGDLAGEVDGGAFVAGGGDGGGVEGAVWVGVVGDEGVDVGDVVLGLVEGWDASVLLDGS